MNPPHELMEVHTWKGDDAWCGYSACRCSWQSEDVVNVKGDEMETHRSARTLFLNHQAAVGRGED